MGDTIFFISFLSTSKLPLKWSNQTEKKLCSAREKRKSSRQCKSKVVHIVIFSIGIKQRQSCLHCTLIELGTLSARKEMNSICSYSFSLSISKYPFWWILFARSSSVATTAAAVAKPLIVELKLGKLEELSCWMEIESEKEGEKPQLVKM